MSVYNPELKVTVFIENEAGSNRKNIFDEKTLQYNKTVTVSREYPFPYGFIVNTTSGDGDCLDCFVLTNQPLKTGQIIDVEPIGMFEQIEDGKDDPKVLAVLSGESAVVDSVLQKTIVDFIQNVFSHLPGKTIKIGRFLGKDEALALVKRSKSQALQPELRF